MSDKNMAVKVRPKIPVRAFVVFGIVALVLPAVIFLAAGTLQWPMGWVYYGIAAAGALLSRAVVAIVDPDLLAERAQSQQAEDMKPWDRSLSVLVGLAVPFISLIVVGMDERWSWSPSLPPWIAVVATVALVLAYGFGTWAMAVNRFFSSVVRIQAERGQHVVTDGPYRMVRHPGYAGGIVSAVATPLMLGSLWGLITAAIYVGLVVVRTALEDRTLHEELPGYREYAERTRYRLVPGIW